MEGWRSNAIVERKKLHQWFFNISKIANELLNDLNLLDGWPEKVKLMQKNWIGKSFGCEIDFQIEIKKKKLKFLLQDLTQFLGPVSLLFLLNTQYVNSF